MELHPIKGPKVAPSKPRIPSESPSTDGNYYSADKDLSKWSTIAPEEVNRLHYRSDVDKSSKAQHHTLGTKRNQASPGSHIHDGRESRKLGTGMGLTLTGSKGGNVALTNLINMLKNFIEFTDSTT